MRRLEAHVRALELQVECIGAELHDARASQIRHSVRLPSAEAAAQERMGVI